MSIDILGVDHIGIAPKKPDECQNFFKLIGLDFLGSDLVKEQGVKTLMFNSSTSGNTPTRLEILQSVSSEGPIAKYLEKKGGGIHHVALRVEDVTKTIEFLKSQNIELVTDSPQKGAHDTKIVFVHPRATGGILVEFVEQN